MQRTDSYPDSADDLSPGDAGGSDTRTHKPPPIVHVGMAGVGVVEGEREKGKEERGKEEVVMENVGGDYVLEFGSECGGEVCLEKHPLWMIDEEERERKKERRRGDNGGGKVQVNDEKKPKSKVKSKKFLKDSRSNSSGSDEVWVPGQDSDSDRGSGGEEEREEEREEESERKSGSISSNGSGGGEDECVVGQEEGGGDEQKQKLCVRKSGMNTLGGASSPPSRDSSVACTQRRPTLRRASSNLMFQRGMCLAEVLEVEKIVEFPLH
eukprot:GDKI01005812.1.p1 GENE.GDKI01005812.1~~GDKI01005812.1.p1  ORF type:complete len:267 (-),score=111.20 GDKI01005812.1:58-858(-)